MTLNERIASLTADRDRYSNLAREIGLEAAIAGIDTPEAEGYLSLAAAMTVQLKTLLEQRHSIAEGKRAMRKAR